MANFESIKTTIDNNIISNGRQSITGSVLNQVLHKMVDETESALNGNSEVHVIVSLDYIMDSINGDIGSEISMTDADVKAILSGKLIASQSPSSGYILADEVYYEDHELMGFLVFHYQEKEFKVVFDLTNKVYLGSQSYYKAIAQKGYVDEKLTELSAEIGKKQDTIADLAAIRSGAAKGATAIQEVKTINGQSIVGSGNIEIQGGGGGGASSDKQGVIRQTQTWTQAADKGYDYVMSNLVRGAIPKANIDLFTSAGAVFNEESGYFELNGLTDISYEEMINIHNYTIPFSVGVIAPQGVMLGRSLPIRTPYAMKAKRYYIFSTGSWDYLFWDSSIERVKIIEPIILASLNTAFGLSKYLSEVDGVISLEKGPNTSGIFTNCWNLRSIQFTNLKASIEIKQSPRLTNASILYMIQNEIATSAIVITLHADAYERAMADAEIQSALEAHPNVSLASA